MRRARVFPISACLLALHLVACAWLEEEPPRPRERPASSGPQPGAQAAPQAEPRRSVVLRGSKSAPIMLWTTPERSSGVWIDGGQPGEVLEYAGERGALDEMLLVRTKSDEFGWVLACEVEMGQRPSVGPFEVAAFSLPSGDVPVPGMAAREPDARAERGKKDRKDVDRPRDRKRPPRRPTVAPPD